MIETGSFNAGRMLGERKSFGGRRLKRGKRGSKIKEDGNISSNTII